MPPTKANNNTYRLSDIAKLFERIFNIAKGSYDYLRDVEFYQEYPYGMDPQELKLPAITYRVGPRLPSMEIKPRQREEHPDPNNPGYMLITTAQRYETKIYFDVWTANNKRQSSADNITDAFESFMKVYQGVIMSEGIGNIYYQGMRPSRVNNWKDEVAHRSIAYLLITEDIYTMSTKTFEEIRVHVDFIDPYRADLDRLSLTILEESSIEELA